MLAFTVSSGADDGLDTLRWAIEQANDNPGYDEIKIAYTVSTITITSEQLPAIEEGVSIAYLGAGRVIVDGQAFASTPDVHGLEIAIDSESYRDVDIADLHLRNFTGSGILVSADLDDLTIANCTIDHNGLYTSSGNYDGIRILAGVDAGGILIQGSEIISNGNGNGYYVLGHGVAMLGHADISVENSYIGTNAGAATGLGNKQSGIYCAGTGSLTVSGCTICGNGEDGINVQGPGDDSLAIQIDCNNIGVAIDESQEPVAIPNDRAGIHLLDCDGILDVGDNDNVAVNLLGNTVANNVLSGILLQHCRYVKIGTYAGTPERHTEVSANGDGTVDFGYGIQIRDWGVSATIAYTEYVKIDGCAIFDNHEEGIQIIAVDWSPPVTHVTISGNTISGNGGEGVCLFGGGVEYVDVIQNAFSNNMQTRWSGEIATWYGTYDKHCRFSQNDFTVLNTKAPIIFECSGSNEGIAPPVINGAGVSFGYDDTAGENVWTIPFTATQGQSVFTDGTFVFEVYASNVDFAYDQGGHVNGYGAGAYVYLEGRDVPCQLDGLVGQGEDFTAKVPASTLNLLPGFTKFLMTATCTEVEEGTKDRNDTSIFSEPVETPPQVTGVTVSNGTDEYAIPAERDSGAQLECVPFRYLPELGYGGPPRITQVQVTFNQDVLVDSGDLTLVDAADENTSYSPTGFSSAYAGGVETATWTFNPITWKQLVLTISSGLEGVTGAEGLQLDGDWTNNPTGFSDEYENSIFPSGNGEPGGDFVFYFTVPSPADFNLDGKVDYTDASILGAHYFQQVPVWGPGDANGDGMANTPDAAIFAYHWGTDFTTWPSEQEKSGGGSKRSASRDLELALDALFERYDFGTPDESRPVEREDNYWNGFIDDFLGIYSEVAA